MSGVMAGLTNPKRWGGSQISFKVSSSRQVFSLPPPVNTHTHTHTNIHTHTGRDRRRTHAHTQKTRNQHEHIEREREREKRERETQKEKQRDVTAHQDLTLRVCITWQFIPTPDCLSTQKYTGSFSTDSTFTVLTTEDGPKEGRIYCFKVSEFSIL